MARSKGLPLVLVDSAPHLKKLRLSFSSLPLVQKVFVSLPLLAVSYLLLKASTPLIFYLVGFLISVFGVLKGLVFLGFVFISTYAHYERLCTYGVPDSSVFEKGLQSRRWLYETLGSLFLSMLHAVGCFLALLEFYPVACVSELLACLFFVR